MISDNTNTVIYFLISQVSGELVTMLMCPRGWQNFLLTNWRNRKRLHLFFSFFFAFYCNSPSSPNSQSCSAIPNMKCLFWCPPTRFPLEKKQFPFELHQHLANLCTACSGKHWYENSPFFLCSSRFFWVLFFLSSCTVLIKHPALLFFSLLFLLGLPCSVSSTGRLPPSSPCSSSPPRRVYPARQTETVTSEPFASMNIRALMRAVAGERLSEGSSRGRNVPLMFMTTDHGSWYSKLHLYPW